MSSVSRCSLFILVLSGNRLNVTSQHTHRSRAPRAPDNFSP
jgi:hypothetical protein